MSEEKSFEFIYSAAEQEEIKKIRAKYEAPEEAKVDKMALLRRLDEGVTRKGTTAALVIGVISTLVMGTGMSLIMTDLGDILKLPYALLIGVVLGLIGMIGVAMAYPVYNKITQKERERITPEILRLTDELMK